MVLIKVIAIHSNSLSSPFPHPCHSLFFSRDHLRSPSGIISGPTWGSFAVQLGDHFRSNLGIICGPIWGSFAVQFGTICGPIWGPFAVRDHMRSGMICGLVHVLRFHIVIIHHLFVQGRYREECLRIN